MPIPQSIMRFLPVLRRRPDAQAVVLGSDENPCLHGSILFYQTPQGVLVLAEVFGLPEKQGCCEDNFFAFHIHSGDCCAGSSEEAFQSALGHYNPENCPHLAHAGDMPPLLSNDGYAVQAFLTNRFSLCEIIGRTVIIHADRDDFTSQPGGDAGSRIACGVIRKPGMC